MSSPGRRSVARRLPLVFTILTAIAFLALGGWRHISLTALVADAGWLREASDWWGILAPVLFIAVSVVMQMMFVPAWFCTMVGGLLFGRWLGTVHALIGTTLGATGLFLAARAGF